MTQIFVSYARPDKPLVEGLVAQLNYAGWSVWWDPVIPPGKRWDDVVEEALRVAKCVVVVWTPNSVASEWVRTEAADAKARGVLVPVILKKVTLPLEFRRIEACDLTEWHPGDANGEFELLLSAIRNLINSDNPNPRSVAVSTPASSLKHRPSNRTVVGVVVGVVVTLALAAFAYFRGTSGSDDSKQVSTAPPGISTSQDVTPSTGGLSDNRSTIDTISDTGMSPPVSSTARADEQMLRNRVWRKNWLTINDPVPGMGSSDGTRATNREQFVDLLTALDLTEAPDDLVRQRDDLLRFLRNAPARPHDPTYNVAVTDDFYAQFRSLKRAIRDQALDAGVAVGDP